MSQIVLKGLKEALKEAEWERDRLALERKMEIDRLDYQLTNLDKEIRGIQLAIDRQHPPENVR